MVTLQMPPLGEAGQDGTGCPYAVEKCGSRPLTEDKRDTLLAVLEASGPGGVATREACVEERSLFFQRGSRNGLPLKIDQNGIIVRFRVRGHR